MKQSRILKFCTPLLLLLICLNYLVKNRPSKALAEKLPIVTENVTNKTWAHACIDTMKTSRDNARRWANKPDLAQIIQKELQTIKNTGANCVAIATPYDKEFLPYLSMWVKEARRQNLTIWFRGNFSMWENWFDYQGDMTTDELFTQGTNFIKDNKQLFKNGDIFTLAPEAENGGPFDQVEIDEHQAFRMFLIEQYKVCRSAFKSIDKNVTCNWFSMNGGLAKRSLNQQTIDQIGGVVTIDHYIKDATEMGEFIDYFYNNFGAKVVIGEYGAPIPQINGDMTPQEQADFVHALLEQIYQRKDKIEGHSYWVLYDGSTRLINYDYSPRPVLNVLKEYFTSTALIEGQVLNTLGKPLENTNIYSQQGTLLAKTDNKGKYSFSVYPHLDTLTLKKSGYQSKSLPIYPKAKTITTYQHKLSPKDLTIQYRLREWLGF